MIESYGVTNTGCLRSENQDRILTDHGLGLFLVADGMGGHSHGETAAELTVATLRYYLESSRDRFDVTWPFGYKFELSIDANRLVTGIQLANRQVWNYAEQKPEYSGMGTTVAALLLSGDNVIIGNVGDSRIYLFRAGELTLMSYDDTFVNSVAFRGSVDPAALTNHPMRNVLTQAAGSQEMLDVHIVEKTMMSGDLFMLSSDGLHGVVGEAAMRSILGSGDNAERTAGRMIEAARANGAPDNVSCILLSYAV